MIIRKEFGCDPFPDESKTYAIQRHWSGPSKLEYTRYLPVGCTRRVPGELLDHTRHNQNVNANRRYSTHRGSGLWFSLWYVWRYISFIISATVTYNVSRTGESPVRVPNIVRRSFKGVQTLVVWCFGSTCGVVTVSGLIAELERIIRTTGTTSYMYQDPST